MSRKLKWKGVHLNNKNIDEYMDDLYNDTKGQYITQGVSFNKDDNFQMNLLKNALLSHGSFSGFVKHLMYNYFEKNNRLDESIWIPNSSNEISATTHIPAQELENENIEQITHETSTQGDGSVLEEQDNPVSPPPPTPSPQQSGNLGGGQQANNQHGNQRPKLRNGGSLNNALLNKQ